MNAQTTPAAVVDESAAPAAAPATDAAARPRRWWAWGLRRSLALLDVAAGFATLIGLGAVAEARWERYPIQTFAAAAYDPSEPLRGAYVDLRIDLGSSGEPPRGT